MPKKVLIVEDNELNLILLTDVLHSKGYEILSSKTGSDIMSIIRNSRPDIILMDIQLPEVSGEEHVKTLKADPSLKNIPIVAVTAFAMKGEKERFLKSGCDDYVAKPFSPQQILDVVIKFIG